MISIMIFNKDFNDDFDNDFNNDFDNDFNNDSNNDFNTWLGFRWYNFFRLSCSLFRCVVFAFLVN